MRKNHSRRPDQGGGFTLIELIAVIVIVMILAGVAVPSLNPLAGTRGAAAARQLLRDATFARQRAVATGTRSWLVFNTGAHTWSILAEDPASPGRASAAVLEDPATGEPFVVSVDAVPFVGVQLQSVDFDTNVEVGFDWLGRPLNQTEAALTLPGSVVLTGNHTVSVAPETGHVDYTAP
jgi:type II secretory pathway pseudopilin PulG